MYHAQEDNFLSLENDKMTVFGHISRNILSRLYSPRVYIYIHIRAHTSTQKKARPRGAQTVESSSLPTSRAIIVEHTSRHVVIFQLAFHLQWMQFSQHSEAIAFYHGHSNPIGRAVEIPHISIYMSALHPYALSPPPHTHIHIPASSLGRAPIYAYTRVLAQNFTG